MNYSHAQPRPRIERRTQARRRRRFNFHGWSLIWLVLADLAVKATLLWLLRPAATLSSSVLFGVTLLVSAYLVVLRVCAERRRGQRAAAADPALGGLGDLGVTLMLLAYLAIPFGAGVVLGQIAP